jgi:threonine dehydratase
MSYVAAPTRAGMPRLPAPAPAALEAVRHLDVRFPAARLREVPLVRAPELDLRADAAGTTRVWLALEALQVTGSFKVRGALVSLDAHRTRGGVVAASAGSHGVAVAYAARVLGLPATVCVPRSAPPARRAKIEKYGAEVVVAATDDPGDVEDLARAIASSRRGAFISQSDDTDVVAGNGSSLGFEIVRALGGVPERVLAPLGGGGLATGLSWALSAEDRATGECAVWGVQSEAIGAAVAASDVDRVAVLCGSSRPPRPAPTGDLDGGDPRAPVAAIGGLIVVTEEQVAAAMAHAYSDLGLIVEGPAAAALAPVLFGLPERVRGGDLVVVLTGRNVDPDRLEAVLRRIGESYPA